MSLDSQENKTIKIELQDTIDNVNTITVDGEGGIKLKNGSISSGFLEFYESSSSGENKIKLQGRDLSEDITLTLPNTSGNLISTGDTGIISTEMLSTSGVTAGDYGSSTAIPVITVDSKGRITNATTSSISTDLNISSDSGNDTVSLGSDTLQFTGGTGINTSISGDTVTHSIDNTVVTLNDTQTIENKTINNSDITLSSGNTINVENGNLTLADQQINGSKILENSLNINRLNQISSMKILGNTNEGTSNISEITLSDNNSLNDSGTVVSTQSAIKYYIDSVASGLDVKESCIVGTTENISLDNTTTEIDGITLTQGDRILVKNQTSSTENGIYIYNTSGSWERANDFNSNTNVTSGSFSL